MLVTPPSSCGCRHAAYGLKPTAKLLRELNEIQGRSLSAAIYLSDDVVMVAQTMNVIGLTRPVLAQALAAVRSLADDIGFLLAGMYGGQTPLSASTHPQSGDAA